MAEFAGKLNKELASAFIVSTCQLIPTPSLVFYDHMHNLMASKLPVPIAYVILCGSQAEFYIRPLVACIDDEDYLVAQTDELTFSGQFPVLPRDLSGLADTIECFKMEPYDSYPGFVRLKCWCEMNYKWEFKKYEFNYKYDTNNYATLDLDSTVDLFCHMSLKRRTMLKKVSGPAVQRRIDKARNVSLLSGTDHVTSIWCPQWPKEAQDWLSRPRNYGWPTTDVISAVVQNGCHLVYVQHRSCRNDKYQWRFSFSCAEVILLRSLTQTQQIVYHLLRFLAKRELIQKDCSKEDEVLCTYHLKTLMLWTCEEMSPGWWNSKCVFTICSELLNKCADWLQKKRCSNYFIPEANLFQGQLNSVIHETTVRQLNKFRDSGILCDWFVENYILFFIRRYSEPMKNMPHFVDYLVPLIERWKANQLKSLEFCFIVTRAAFHEEFRSILKHELHSGIMLLMRLEGRGREAIEFTPNSEGTIPIIRQFESIHHDKLLCILHTAYGLDCGEISWDGSLCVESVNAISTQSKITRSTYHNFPRSCSAQSSRFQFLRAMDIMQNMTGSSGSEFQLLSLMAKEFLRKTLKNYGAITIFPAALAYLAALHYAASEYKDTTRLCSAVLMDQTSLADKESLNAGCLLFIDDVSRIIGLCLLQKKITENNLHFINGRFYMDLRLSPEMFAHYLSGLSAERMSKQSTFYHAFPDSLIPMDVNLKALIKPKSFFSMKLNSFYRPTAARQIVYRRAVSLIETKSSKMNHTIVKQRVLDALIEYALENMASFYNVIRKDFGVNCNTADCYRALYLYKCRQYDQVLHLCEQILKDSDLRNDLKKFAFANVLLLPPFDYFFDRDVQSLLGFHTLFYYLNPLNDYLGEIELTAESTFEQLFARNVHHNNSDLMQILGNHNLNRNHYFLGRHFLARYLKLRCCIDYNLPYTVSKTEFATQEINLPFEHIIRKFFLQKLRISKSNSSICSYQ